MAKIPLTPSFSEVVTRLDHEYFGKYGVFGVSEDDRTGTIWLHVDERMGGEFSPQLREQVKQACEPYTVNIEFEPRAHLLSGG